MEKDHVLVGLRVERETGVSGALPAPDASRGFGVMGPDPAVQTVNPRASIPEFRVALQHRFPVNGEREEEERMQMRDNGFHKVEFRL